jgi:gliding motility-associated-like protein
MELLFQCQIFYSKIKPSRSKSRVMFIFQKTPLPLLLYGILLLSIPLQAQIAIDSVTYDPCFTGSPGTIPVTVFASGGSGQQYQVSTDNGVSYGPFGTYTFNLATGNSYDIIASDSLGGLSDTVQITIPANELSSSISLQLNYNGQALSCFKASDGSAEAQATGGAGPYTYNWNTFPTQTTAIATGLGAGVYDVTVTDANGCNSESSVTVSEPGSINITTNQTDVSCNSFTDGTATASAVGGTGSLSYVWNTAPTQTTATATGLAPGTYSVTATDANGCVKIEFVTITEPSAITLSTSNTPTNCAGVADGTASVTPTGGNTPFSYNWDSAPSQTTATATGLAAGSYNVTVTDNSGCTVSESVTVTEPSAVSVTAATSLAISCGGASDGEATATGLGGDGGPYNYIWSTSPTQNTATATGLSVGSYTVTATDGNGCEAITTITLTEPSPVSVTTAVSSNYNGQDISCNGASDGEAIATGSGGDGGPYNYQWSTSPAQNTAIAIGLAAGTYTVTLSDGNGCSVTDNITLNEPTDITVSTSVTSDYNGQDISCNGATDGDVLATASGGTGTLNYQWSSIPAQNTAAATALAAGVYSVTVSDANACEATADVTLTEPSEISLTTAVSSDYNGQNISCNGATDGEATGAAAGGTPGYTYVWDDGQTTAIATGLAAGTYTLTTTDINGCEEVESISLTEPSAVSVTTAVNSNYNGQDVSCNGASDGSAFATGAGGTTTYSYQWSTAPMQMSDTATALAVGVYSVTMTDINGCSVTENVTITEPSAVSVTAAITSNYNGQDISCNGATDGSTQATASGGTATYTYEWSTAPTQTTAIATGLGAGVYTVTTTDVNGCQETTNITLTEPSAVSITAAITSNYNGQDVSCQGAADGEATGTASGGTAGYSYQWSTTPTQSTQIATGLAAGVYTVSTTDINGCEETTNITITEPSAITTSTAVTSNYNGSQISCNGATDGEATTTSGGGTGPLSYQWNTSPTQNTNIATGLSAGDYIVTITDLNACVLIDTIALTEPDVVNTQAVATSNYNGVNISCLGANDGSASANTTGGTGTYTYNWNSVPLQTTITATGLEAGTYIVTVTDVNGCSDTSQVTLTEPAAAVTGTIATSDYNGFGVSCNGTNDGDATAQINVGFAPYNYQWSNGSTTQNITGLAAGTYIVTMTDDNGCSFIDSVILTEPPVLNITSTVTSSYNGGFNVSCFNATDGAADATANGGVPGYSYQWSNGGNTQNITAIAAGVYTVTVTDDNACTTTSTVTLTEPNDLVPSITQTAFVSCNGDSDAALAASATGGTPVYSYQWSNTTNTANIVNITAGSYDVTITDDNGCTVSETFVVTEPDVLAATSSSTSSFCNQSNGTVTVNTVGGTNPYNYQWSTGATTAAIGQLLDGVYSYTVTDVNGCIFSGIDTVDATSYQISLFANVEDSDCYAPNSGSIDASTTGGFFPMSYEWSGGETDSSLTSLANGTYTLTATDVNGCFVVDSFVIENLETPIAISLSSPLYPNGFNTTRTDEEDGSIDATVTGGVSPLGYLWSNADTTEDLTEIPANTYVLTVTDVNGCIAVDSITLTEPEPEEPVMPEGISPDGDGLNDFFVIQNIEFYPDNILLIYNRWGDEVQRIESYNNQWDGNNKGGNPLPAGTYYVILQLTDRDQHYKGIVEIRRR